MLRKDYEFQRLPYEMLLYVPNPPPFTSSALLWLQVLQENKFLNYFGVFFIEVPRHSLHHSTAEAGEHQSLINERIWLCLKEPSALITFVCRSIHWSARA